MEGSAFCPAHITGFFKAELDNQSLEQMGSLGAGFSIQKGVTTTVKTRKKTKDDKKNFSLTVTGYTTDNTQVSEFVTNEFLNFVNDDCFVDIQHDITVPVGYGMGCSAAAALSLGLALNQALETNLTRTEVANIAHKAEITCKTGLGDVLASYHGGFEIRTKSGAPGIGNVEKMNTDSSTVIMICFSPVSTKQFLNERMSSINGLGGKMVNKLVQSKSCEDFQDMSIEFANYVEMLTPKMNDVIQDLHENGIKCGAAMFGETVFTMVPDDMVSKVLEILKKYKDGIIIQSKIDNTGARLFN